MRDGQPAVIAIERATGIAFSMAPLRVFIDGHPAGIVRRGETNEFPVAAGEHSIAVTLASCRAGPIRLVLGSGEHAELRCETNQPPPHRWHVHAVWFIVFFVAMDGAGHFIPAIRQFAKKYLLAEVLIAMMLGGIGMTIHFREVYLSGAWFPTIFLTTKSDKVDSVKPLP